VNYAALLDTVRGDFDQAERLYREALELNPNQATAHGNYAILLWTVRADDAGAERHFRRSLELDPNRAYKQGSFAGFLLAHGKTEEGRELLSKALSNPSLQTEHRLEFLFYRAAYEPAARPDALAELRSLLAGGVRAPHWSAAPHLAELASTCDPDLTLLQALSAVIEGNEPGAALGAGGS